MRPANIEQLGLILERLVTFGGACVPNSWRNWLRHVGIAHGIQSKDWMCPTRHFLVDAVPARNALDLTRRAALRDPLYRTHLDLSLISVIHAVAVAERWQRLEELIFHACLPAAPRLMLLLESQIERLAHQARNLSDADWKNARLTMLDGESNTFFAWDRQLWGDCRGPSDLFPLLLDLYLPLTGQPVHLSEDDERIDAASRGRVAQLILAAIEGEGLVIPASELEITRRLQDSGVPVRTWAVTATHFSAALVARVACECSYRVSCGDLTAVPGGLAELAKQSYCIHSDEVRVPTRLSAIADDGESTIAMFSVSLSLNRWPDETPEESPSWMRVPGVAVFSAAGKRRTDSPEADDALLSFSDHPLYGFILQLLLLEALDRELGEETLILALPPNSKIASVEEWADTKVLYRPRIRKANSYCAESQGFLVLGLLDDVFTWVARELGIVSVATPFVLESGGPWSRAIALMSTAQVVDGRPDRWILTATTHILDRLHSGTLMRNVIREGRALRDKMHSVLLTLWREKSETIFEEELSA
jgi:hypothetical protein